MADLTDTQIDAALERGRIAHLVEPRATAVHVLRPVSFRSHDYCQTFPTTKWSDPPQRRNSWCSRNCPDTESFHQALAEQIPIPKHEDPRQSNLHGCDLPQHR